MKKDINSFVWKNKKVKDDTRVVQSEVKLIEMNTMKLRDCYYHCQTMLNNEDIDNLGRKLILQEIKQQIDFCGAELAIRWLESNYTELSRFNILNLVSEAVKHPEAKYLKDLFNGLNSNFLDIPLKYIVAGCRDKLGKINKKHITLAFIYRQGLWLTPIETQQLVEQLPNGEYRDRMEIVKEKLKISQDVKLYMNASGLSFAQLKGLIDFKKNHIYNKYSTLTTPQLETLRYKLLFNLEDQVKMQIKQWEDKMGEIEEVAKFKNIEL